MPHPRIYVVALGGQRVHAKLSAPGGPRLEVTPVGRGRVGRMAKEPSSGQAKERIVGRSARQPVERFGAHGGDRGSDVDGKRHQGHVGNASGGM